MTTQRPVDSTRTQRKTQTARTRRAAALYLLCAADAPLAPPARYRLADVQEVLFARGAMRAANVTRAGATQRLTIHLADATASARHAHITWLGGTWYLADLGSRNGVFVNGIRQGRAELEDGDILEIARSFFLFRMGVPDAPTIAAEVADVPFALRTLVPELEETFAKLQRIGPSLTPILISGPTGTGKELTARAVHELSGRSGAFVAVHCAAIPKDLLASALFGHLRGSFTGATEDAPGYFRTAHGGTLFLDEIGDMPLDAQVTLLRALQERTVRPVGGQVELPIDVQLVTATNGDPKALVDQGRFRQDLLGRISGFHLELPPLRERQEDMGRLVGALLRKVAPDPAAVTFDRDAVQALLAYDWPHNIRELEMTLASAVALSGGAPIGLEHLPTVIREEFLARMSLPPPPTPRPPPLDDRHRQLLELLAKHGGNLSAVALEMGKNRKQIQRWVKVYRIDIDALRAPVAR